MTRPPISIILLNFNGASDTIECLESLLAARIGGAAVILVDNGSTDDSVARLQAWNDKQRFFDLVEGGGREEFSGWAASDFSPSLLAGHAHTLLLSPENLGFAAGNNLGTRLALARGGEEVLLLNNDTTVAPAFLEALEAAGRDHPHAVLVPQIRLYHQPDRLWNCGGDLRWPGRKVYRYENAAVNDLPDDEVMPVTFVTGCALLYRPSVSGLLTERFFFGEEDMEFSLRLRDRGIQAYCVPASVIHHKVGSTLATGFRKSEVFTLKRLVNLRTRGGLLTVSGAYVYYLANLLRLLVLRYGLGPGEALTRVVNVGKASLRANEVGADVCVDYVRGKQTDL